MLLRWLLPALLTATAFWLRTDELARRPMHADEANQAVKVGELLDAGRYVFDPRDHHGPTLYYAAVPIAWLRGERSLATLSETTVRLVPALAGTAAVLLLVAVGAGLCREVTASQAAGRGVLSADASARVLCWPALAAGAFLAVSPPAVYYSRYFIQETLLATFTLAAVACAQRWWSSRLTRWSAAAGMCVGLMQATKASAPLFIVAAAVALWLGRASVGLKRPPLPAGTGTSPLPQIGIAMGAAVGTAALLYSSFGTNPMGVHDALAAYTQAFTRFGAASEPTGHEKPWWYYLRLFGGFREGGLVWHQALFSALAVTGLVVACVRRAPFLRGAAIYTVIIAAAFSVFAYKTPWHAVHFVPGCALLAGAALTAIARLRGGPLIAMAAALLTAVTLYKQTGLVAFRRPADARNPYAYVHSSADVLKYRAQAEAAGARFPDQPIHVISEEYWPLPWYLRGLPRVGFYTAPPDNCDGALVIVSASQADAVRAKLRGTYRESFLGLRPGFVCILFTLEP